MDLHVINKYFNETENHTARTKDETSQNRPITYSIQYACFIGWYLLAYTCVFLSYTGQTLVDVAESILSDGGKQNVKTFKHVPTTSEITGFHLPRCNLSHVTNFNAEYRRNMHIHYTSYM